MILRAGIELIIVERFNSTIGDITVIFYLDVWRRTVIVVVVVAADNVG
jgi:hypothetical protein